ncbi:ABC transporter permease subunit [Nonomuraea sp. NN258]|uniref:ABC transporter permease n=1 Tax=Nonomuraea antri TaxID=2730852 RepID=UPI001567D8C6|nr:ABC transporter permease subunit [Nonomuraea antri]NRQ36971.1 ABC transporter permease subunit [Nonomuraea antri]
MTRRVLLALLAVYFGLPLLASLLYALATRWTDTPLPDGYTLEHWAKLVTDADVASALVRSLVLSAVVVAIEIVLVVPAAYWAVVRNPRIGSIVQTIAVIPFAIPWVVVGAGIQLVTKQVAPQLFGTFWLLAASTAAISFPFMYRAVESSLLAAGAVRLSEAAATCGANPLQTLVKVILPAIRGGVVSGSLLVIATAMNEFALAKILVGVSYETLPLWSARQFVSRTLGDPNALAVVTVFTFGLLFALSALVVWLGRGRVSASMANTAPVQKGTTS